MKTAVSLICLLFISFVIAQNSEDYTNDSPEISPKKEILRQKVGSIIYLKCKMHHRKINNNISWEFKHCKTNYKGMYCESHSTKNQWKRLKWRRRKLEVRNSREANSGLYRCSVNGSVVKLFAVEMIGPTYWGPPPEVQPLLSTSVAPRENSNIIIQCKTFSVTLPEIRWFKSCPSSKCNVQVGDQCFCSINSTSPMHSFGNMYLSKLNIYNAKYLDGGIYACLAISMYGKDYKSLYISVLSSENQTGKTYSLLFLIPLCFLLVPIIVWLCYYKKKNVTILEHNTLIKPVVQVDITTK